MAQNLLVKKAATSYGAVPEQQSMAAVLKCLGNIEQMEVKEKADVLEAAFSFLDEESEMASRHQVFAVNGDGVRRELLYAVEEADMFGRILKLLLPSCSPWRTKVMYTEGTKTSLAFTLQREFSCACCCFNRPVVDMLDGENGEKIGSLQDQFRCCGMTMNVIDKNGDVQAQAQSGCCQFGLWCCCPCRSMSQVQLDVTDSKTHRSAASMSKALPNCWNWLCTGDVDPFKMDFEKTSDPQLKALLVGLAIFLDFRYFGSTTSESH